MSDDTAGPPEAAGGREPVIPRAEQARTALGRWWLDLPLRRKGALLTVVPLAVAAIVLVAAVVLHERDAAVRNDLEVSASALLEVSHLVELLDEAESSVLGYAATRDERRLDAYTVIADGLPARLDAFRRDVPDGYEASTEEVAAETEDAIRALGEAAARIRTGAVDPQATATTLAPATEAAAAAVRVAGQMRLDLLDDLAGIVDEDDRVQTQTTWILALGLLLVIVTSIAGGAILSTSILGRTVRLSDNVRRFSAGEPLLPTLAARDEIGHLTTALGRSAQLLSAQRDDLTASRDAALAAARARDEFLSRMSHELRTPLTAVIGFGQLLQAEDLTPDQRESVDHIVQAGRHLLGLIDDAVDTGRIQAGVVSLSLGPVELGGLVGEAVALVRPQADERGVTIATGPMAGVAVRADAKRLQQVLLNLLTNAVKFNRPGGRVEVTATASGRDGGAGGGTDHRVRLAVTDTGPGIAPQEVERLFRPFERLGAAARGIDGIGVGLAVSRELVEAMGGTIGIETRLGDGATFWVDLPRSRAGAGAVPAPPTDAGAIEAGDGRLVLYIEDDPASIGLVARLLRDRPERVEAAASGREGLARARELRPDLVLLDLNLPDLDGIEVLRRLKDDAATAPIPVAVISADFSARRRAAAREAGAIRHLAKPVDVPALLALLDAAAGEEQAPAPPPRPKAT